MHSQELRLFIFLSSHCRSGREQRKRIERHSHFQRLKPRPESGLDCLTCAMFARKRTLASAFALKHRCSYKNADLIWTISCDKTPGSTKITTHLDHIGPCETISGTHWLNRWTYRVFIINTRRDQSVSREGAACTGRVVSSRANKAHIDSQGAILALAFR